MEDLAFDFEAEIDAKDVLRRASLKADGTTSSESAATRGRHSIVCKHWLRNLCMKGEKCDFLHQYDPNRMPECVFWLKFGKCNDPECVFRHVAPSERPECQRYRLGFCRHGAMCRSRHERLPREALPELLPDWFLDSLLLNPHLVPRSDEVNLLDLRRDRGRNGSPTSELAPARSAPATEQGTIPGLPPPIHGRCRYFIMRSMNVRNIQISAAKGIWASSLGNSQRLRQAFRDVDHVIMVFSATESRSFSGYGRMASEPDELLFPGIWGDLSCRLSANMRVHWLKQCTAPLAHADHIKNPQNDDLPVRRCRDGQELPSSVGERLCRFLWQQPDCDLLQGSDLEFEPRVRYDLPALPAPGDAQQPPNSGGEPEQQAAPLAIEDAKKEGGEQEDSRARPAPAPLGTFQREAGGGQPRGGGPAPVAVGRALASGSSSLLAAMAEEAHRYGQPPPGAWPPPMGWQPHPPHDWVAQHRLPPAHYYPPPPGCFRPYPHPLGPPGGPGPYGEVRPPGYWGGGGGPPLPERAHFGERGNRQRSRSRARHRRRK